MKKFLDHRQWFEKALALAQADEARMVSARMQRLKHHIYRLSVPKFPWLVRVLLPDDDLTLKRSIQDLQSALSETEARLRTASTGMMFPEPSRLARWLSRRRLLKENASRLTRYNALLLKQRRFYDKLCLYNRENNTTFRPFNLEHQLAVLLPDNGEAKAGMRRLLSDEPEIDPPLDFLVPSRGLPSGLHVGTASLNPYNGLTIDWCSHEKRIECPYNQARPATDTERMLLKEFDCIVREAKAYRGWDEDHITFSIITSLNKLGRFVVRYGDGVAVVDVNVNKDYSLRGIKHGDMILIIDLNFFGDISSGVRYFEAKKSKGDHTYRQSSSDQINKILEWTRCVSLLAYDHEAPSGEACLDAPLEVGVSSIEFTMEPEAARPFASALVQDYFRLKDMDLDKSRVGKVRDQLDRVTHGEPRIAVAHVTIDNSQKSAQKRALARELALEKSLSRAPDIKVSRRR